MRVPPELYSQLVRIASLYEDERIALNLLCASYFERGGVIRNIVRGPVKEYGTLALFAKEDEEVLKEIALEALPLNRLRHSLDRYTPWQPADSTLSQVIELTGAS
ncbi:hypothetical protein COU17_02120 [Candidatus Kaiserbacteria bacterium CG10_big_fil_rev_8_21_14_0_10_49_17]|uniref:Uncharacterized protein n=1 Tax=Candidatus Kaiserbacteria bacterium CG10_big_fil_rev_8_21_14_0_10_49_17 TaxID=1974609 RepID=A0A2M6WEB9_9BACT|nr:MAG: hypothetical protein COU17_02120 [Candidatus Kaiserbacteria bacterium CG10_big_fil_rev_8_21_14_0_10_49_17]